MKRVTVAEIFDYRELRPANRSARIRIPNSVPETAIVSGKESLCSAKQQYAVNASEARNTKFVHADVGRWVATADFRFRGTLSPQT